MINFKPEAYQDFKPVSCPAPSELAESDTPKAAMMKHGPDGPEWDGPLRFGIDCPSMRVL